jgi:hypothetical protein
MIRATQADAIGGIADGAHHGDDLLDRRRVWRILKTLVAGRPAVVVAGQGRG